MNPSWLTRPHLNSTTMHAEQPRTNTTSLEPRETNTRPAHHILFGISRSTKVMCRCSKPPPGQSSMYKWCRLNILVLRYMSFHRGSTTREEQDKGSSVWRLGSAPPPGVIGYWPLVVHFQHMCICWSSRQQKCGILFYIYRKGRCSPYWNGLVLTK
jgi:hypothetical protein